MGRDPEPRRCRTHGTFTFNLDMTGLSPTGTMGRPATGDRPASRLDPGSRHPSPIPACVLQGAHSGAVAQALLGFDPCRAETSRKSPGPGCRINASAVVEKLRGSRPGCS